MEAFGDFPEVVMGSGGQVLTGVGSRGGGRDSKEGDCECRPLIISVHPCREWGPGRALWD